MVERVALNALVWNPAIQSVEGNAFHLPALQRDRPGFDRPQCIDPYRRSPPIAAWPIMRQRAVESGLAAVPPSEIPEFIW